MHYLEVDRQGSFAAEEQSVDLIDLHLLPVAQLKRSVQAYRSHRNQNPVLWNL